MATKVNSSAGRTHIESENVVHTVKVDNNRVGTAIKLLEALETTDATISSLGVGEDHGVPKITVWGKYAGEGERQPVPKPIHKQLVEWGYEHANKGNDGPQYNDDMDCHVYTEN